MVQTIYHGSYTIIEQPKLMDGRFTKDFGNGFYCTTLKHQAARWAGRYDTPIVNIYEYQENPSLKIKKFEDLTDEWLDFVVACRSGKPHGYDIVTGPMADDQIYNYVADFMNGIYTREQFWVMAKFKYPTNQIVFCTSEALKCITHKGFEEV
nr:DUF3990 domain-containing protein [uncultured Prevotella sp.]